MKIFLAGENQKKHIIPFIHEKNYEVISGGNREQALALRERERERERGDLKIYLAGVAPWKEQGLYDKAITTHRPYILESFYYVNDDTKRLLPYFGDFLLDSGAFTFMQGKGGSPNWDEYIERYANFIKENKVQKYFELDIDSVVGYERVKKYRRQLEALVGWQCIPVWHKSRGIKEFQKCVTNTAMPPLEELYQVKSKKNNTVPSRQCLVKRIKEDVNCTDLDLRILNGFLGVIGTVLILRHGLLVIDLDLYINLTGKQ